ncbi:MAG TPA: hypothetical protein ACFE0H_12770 [Elainellaceae cyanobacterium]
MKQCISRFLGLGLIVSALISAACSRPAVPQKPNEPPQVITGAALSGHSQRRLTLKLTLSSPDDLKVREGDRLSEGDIISDRVKDRQRLEARKADLERQMAQLQQPIPGPPPARLIPETAGLPPASFLDELADVERIRLQVDQAERNLIQQQRMFDMLQSMPSANLPEATIPHEQEMLSQRQQAVEQTQADLQLTEAKLAQAQQDRQYQEYLHSIEMSKRALSIQQQELQRQEQLQNQQSQERDRSFQLAQLEAQLEQIDLQLITLSAVRSPFNGRVQRIQWEGQNDQNLIAELVLVADVDGGSSSNIDGSVDTGFTDEGTE